MSIRLMSEFFGMRFGSANRKSIAVRLADFADDLGRGIWPSVERVAEDCELSARTVQRVLDDFVTEGLLIVVRRGGGGPGVTTRYDFDLDAVRAKSADIGGAGGAGAAENKGDTVSPLENGKGDSGAAKGDNGDNKGDTVSPNPSEEPSEEEPSPEREARAGEPDGQEGGGAVPLAPAETPGRADFDKRVNRMCSGTGFLAGPWPKWDKVALGWIAARFADLTPGERAEAERWRDPYLLDCRDRKTEPMGLGVFLRDKAWNALDPVLLQRAERMKAAQLPPEERAVPDGWAKLLGPVGMARLFAELLAGPPAGAGRPLWLDVQIRTEWPAVYRWKTLQQTKAGDVFGPRWHALKPAMEAVPVDTGTHAAWKAAFAARGWPWLACLDGMDVVWAPKGGPAGLDEFEGLVRGKSDDGGTWQAAE